MDRDEGKSGWPLRPIKAPIADLTYLEQAVNHCHFSDFSNQLFSELSTSSRQRTLFVLLNSVV